jgi:large subunit ribosomal protein L23
MNNVIIKPIITEQSMAAAQTGKFTFLVARFADKPAIKNAVERMFSVNVKGISTTVIKGKTKRVGARRAEVVETPVKKAVVQLRQGEKIGLFELGGEQ